MASISVDQMRTKINELYNGNWQQVLTMPNEQVMAIYYQKLNSGAFDKKKQEAKKKIKQDFEDYYYQMSIFDYAKEENV